MATLINDADLERELLEQRRAWGADKYDEVWDGVYVMSPAANDEHQDLAGEFHFVFRTVLGCAAKIRQGVNISDRRKGWRNNYRVPDVAVFLAGTKAVNLITHWLGGPDFGVEIVSPNDRTHEKIPFYEKVGAGELLVVCRDPWKLELYRRDAEQLLLVGESTLPNPAVLTSHILPLTFELVADTPRPRIRIRHRDTGEEWLL